MQIVGRWKDFFGKCPQDDHKREVVWKTIDELKKSLHFGHNSESIAHYDKIPEDLKTEWIRLLYGTDDHFDASALDRLITILNNSALEIPSREKSRKTLIQLKALAETMNQLEQNTNFILRDVLNGGDDKEISEILNNSP